MLRRLNQFSFIILAVFVVVAEQGIAGSGGGSLDASAIFQEPPAFAAGGNNVLSIGLADLNGDGQLDAVVANGCVSGSQCGSMTAGSLDVMLGNGNGTFQAPVSYFTGATHVSFVTVADINGDGKADLVVGGSCPNGDCTAGGTVSVLLGNGDGTFHAGLVYSAPSGAGGAIVVADVNADGKPDIIAAGGSLGVFLGNGDGTFQPEVTYGGGGNAAISVAVADVNGDGKLDLIAANQTMGGTSNGGVGVLLGNGDGTFQSAVTYLSGGQNARSLVVSDVNGDARPDIVVANDSINGDVFSGGVGVLFGNGDGTFQPAVTYASGAYGTDFAVVLDVNADGKADLLISSRCQVNGSTTNCSNGIMSVLLGNGDGTFQPAVRYTSGGGAIAVGDINGDGRTDALVATSSSIEVLIGDAAGGFQSARIFSSGVYPDTSAATADLNGDGKPDLIVANLCATRTNCAGGGVGVLLGNGDGTFQSPAFYGTGAFNANSVAIADVNGDGKPDVVVAKQCTDGTCSSGTVGVLLGNADGSLQTVVNYGSGGQYAYSVAIADVNGDGKPDVIVANQCASPSNCASGAANGTVGVLLGNGDGSFRTAVTYGSGGQYAVSLALADVNGDGKRDLIVGNYYAASGNSNGSVGVLLGNGDGTFQPAISYSSGGVGDNSVAIADINGDGKLDLITANQCGSSCSSGVIGVLLGDGDGTFQPAILSATPVINIDYFEPVVLADFNGDGKLDVACGAGNFLLLGNGDGSFQSPVQLGAGGVGIALADFNLDGKPDLAVGGITVLLNITPRTTNATATSVQSSVNPSKFNQSVLLTATVTSLGTGTPTGTVTFYDVNISLGTATLSGGTAAINTSVLVTGSHTITAAYSGDPSFTPSVSQPLSQAVQRASTSTSVSSNPNPAVFGQSIALLGSVLPQYGGTATGTLTFYDGASSLGSNNLSSNAAGLSGVKLGAGSHQITAAYAGDINLLGSTSTVMPLTVNRSTTTTTLVSSANPATPGQTVAYTASIRNQYGGAVSGNVTFKDGTVVVGTISLAGNIAKFNTAYKNPGTHSLTATFSGDANNVGSTSAVLTETVQKHK